MLQWKALFFATSFQSRYKYEWQRCVSCHPTSDVAIRQVWRVLFSFGLAAAPIKARGVKPFSAKQMAELIYCADSLQVKWMPCVTNPSTAGNQERSKNI